MLYGQGLSNEEEIKASFEDGRLYFRSFMMRSGNTSFSVGGDIDLNKSFNVFVQGKTSLLPFKGLSSNIRDLTGDADFVFGVQGPWEKPALNGGIEISKASFAIKKFPKRLSSVNGYIYVDEDRVVVQRLSGMFGGGDLEVTGLVKLEGFSMKEFYLDAILNNITFNPSEGFAANLGGNVLFRGSPEGGDITGELRINSARYRERLEWKSWLLKTRPAVLPKAELDWADKIELNVKVYGTDNITIDNNIARAPLKIDMVVRGTVGSPALLGRVESREGTVYFRNNEFRIVHATADFTDIQRTSPYIDIFAETTSKGYHIWLSLQGRVEQFDLTLTSDPPLDEVEILALLTVGEFGESLSGLEGGIGAAEATSFLTGKFQDVVEERLKNITGFSRFQIDPYVSKTTGTVAPRITVSKRLMSDRLFVTYSTAVGTTEEQELKLEYLLSTHISLLGARDELGTLGGDVKFRFEFK
jgi:translocation and assembly module TamB